MSRDPQTVPESGLTVILKNTRKINALGFIEYYSIIDMCNSSIIYWTSGISVHGFLEIQ